MFEQYNISKLFNVLFTVGLNNLINKNGLSKIKTASLHPGTIATNFGESNGLISCLKPLCCCILKEPD